MPDLNYGSCLAVFIFAAMIGSASHVPGGLGAFEAKPATLIGISSCAVERQRSLACINKRVAGIMTRLTGRALAAARRRHKVNSLYNPTWHNL
jgi:hypothetical protein